MIKILIIEDEIPARKKLKRFLEKQELPLTIAAEIDTVTSGITFLKNNSVDLIFSDIELLDGNCFEIFSEVSLSCPVIFTTAYDNFWMNAFENNGVDYLLKPFSQERFQKSLDKFLMLRKSDSEDVNAIADLTRFIQHNFQQKQYRTRFTINHHRDIYFLETAEILFFEAREGIVLAHDKHRKKHLLSFSTLKEIEEQLNPVDFFRINRSELIHKPYIEKIERYNKNTYAVKLKGWETYLKTSQSNTALFREWIEK